MKRFGVLFVGIAAAAALGGCSTTSKNAAATPPAPVVTSETTEGKGKVEQVNTVQATATVAAINQKTREVTLRRSDGTVDTFRVSDEVRNLPQVKKGDQVVVTYYESLELQLKKKGTATPGVTEDAAVDRAAVGQMPGAAGARAITVVARITAIDRKTQMVTLQGPKGKTKRIHVKNPAHLENARVGDLVEATYTEAVAIAVEKPGAKK